MLRLVSPFNAMVRYPACYNYVYVLKDVIAVYRRYQWYLASRIACSCHSTSCCGRT